MQVLAGDIGGTKTLLALAEVEPADGRTGAPRVAIHDVQRFDSHAFPGLAGVCRAYAAQLGRKLPARAAFGVAGPVKNGRCQTTNLPWILDEHELSAALPASHVRLINDFGALAFGIQAVQPDKLVLLNEGAGNPDGPTALIGAGTGLGEAITASAGAVRVVLTTEGGHTSFAPRDELEMGILRFLGARHGHVSWERLLSGEGLVNLAEGVAHHTGLRMPRVLAEAIASDRLHAPALVTAQARAGDALCGRVLQIFCSLYGAEAGNLALKTLATGGVYVAGGIAPKILPELSDGRFRDAFLDKGRMRPLLEAMPVRVVLDEQAGLLGAALLAAQDDGRSSSPLAR
ncbi:MAG: glucokinase [Myxococcales bacterium]